MAENKNNNRLDTETRLKVLQRMLEIRHSEEQIQGLFLQNLVRGSTHLCIGQEASSAGIAWALRPGDTVTCTYRGHGHALAMGVEIKALMAEMMGKEAGVCGGKGGSMHMTQASLGLLGANAIVGAHLPISVGAGLSAQVLGEDRVSVCIFGEGTSNIGAFHESLNLAAVWKLPVVFVCENNLYSEYSPMEAVTSVADIAQRACAYDMPGVIVDGQDVEVVWTEMLKAMDHARSGNGPILVEIKTYRYRGHSRTDQAPYRKKGELEEWLKRDPIDLLRDRMIDDGEIDQTEFEELQQAVERQVHDAVEWAKQAPFPPEEALFTNIYYEETPTWRK